jgi:hypothetical protein
VAEVVSYEWLERGGRSAVTQQEDLLAHALQERVSERVHDHMRVRLSVHLHAALERIGLKDLIISCNRVRCSLQVSLHR